jgi:hypothetical protein
MGHPIICGALGEMQGFFPFEKLRVRKAKATTTEDKSRFPFDFAQGRL